MDRVLPDLEECDQGLTLNLGCGWAKGNKYIPGAIGLDLPDWDANTMPIPYPDASVGTIHAFHFLEHVDNVLYLLAECQRVLMVGGVMNIVVPYYSSALQAQDFTHRRAFCEDTWKTNFANAYYHQPGAIEQWKFRVGLNIIIGIVERNLCLMTQLIKVA